LTIGANQVDEKQNYGRMDAELERDVADDVKAKLSLGGVAERAKRDVDASYLESPTVSGNSNLGFSGATPTALGQNVTDRLDRTVDGTLSGMRFSTNDSSREIDALFLDSKFTLFRKLDLLGGFRFEDILIQSNNAPFTGGTVFGAPQIFPSRYLFLDRFDNPLRGERSGAAPAGTTYNDQLLGINVPTSPGGIVDLTTREQIESLINGSIEEQKWLPSAGLAYRVNSRLTLRTAFSQTVARPSFREMGYYVSVEPGSNDLTVGNPQLQLSTVESWDARAEYTWGNEGDLVAFSVFQKKIDNAIESIVIRDPGNAEGGGLYRTFFNNQSEADLKGLEFEARKDLGFIGDGIGDYFSLGGNITYIKAEVGRSAVEVARGAPFFGVLPGVQENFTGLASTRRLYNQPEWIANVDLTFDNPNSGTSATLAVFAISDVLNSAGSATFAPNGQPIAYTLDRYTASFHQVDLVLSQKWGQWTFRFSVKNLTDTTRKIIYDPSQLASEVAERSFQVGRDYSISASYQF
jgi:outer membrane receptor protein involved in Fe transport